MPTWDSFAKYNAEWDQVARKLDAGQRRKITLEMAVAGREIADRQASRDLGADRAFTGWNRNNRLPLDLQLRPGRRDATLILPTKASAGPWTVAEQGRNQGNASGFVGPGINRRTGATVRRKNGTLRKVRAFRARQWNGVTQPMHTATEAVQQMSRVLPPIADRAYRRVLVKHFDVT